MNLAHLDSKEQGFPITVSQNFLINKAHCVIKTKAEFNRKKCGLVDHMYTICACVHRVCVYADIFFNYFMDFYRVFY